MRAKPRYVLQIEAYRGPSISIRRVRCSTALCAVPDSFPDRGRELRHDASAEPRGPRRWNVIDIRHLPGILNLFRFGNTSSATRRRRRIAKLTIPVWRSRIPRTMNIDDTGRKATGVLFQSSYGCFQAGYWWLFGIVGIIGLVGVPVGIFCNKGWEAGNHPLEPWAATMIIEILSVGALMIVAAVGISSMIRRKTPQRVAVTERTLIVPKGMFSPVELVLPFTEIDTTVFDAGFVKQLQVKYGRRKILLSSALFPSNAAFDRLVSHLPQLQASN